MFLLSVYFGSLVAEEAYRPMLKEGKEWNCYMSNGRYEWNIVFSVNGDTIINGDRCFKMSYKMIDQHTGATVGEGNNALYLEKDKRVYLREKIRDSWNWRLLCDFNLQVGDKKPGTNRQVTAIDNVYVQGAHYRRFHLSEPGEFAGEVQEGYWVEGVGSSRGLLDTSSWAVTGGTHKLITCYEDGKCIFTSENFENMPSGKTDAVRRKLVREDKEWWYHDSEAEMYLQEPYNFYMYADGDTLINGLQWKKIYQKRAEPIYEKAMREEGGRVYELRPGGEERLLFDFSLNVGDIYEPADEPSRMMTVIAIDTVMVDSVQARRRLLLMQQVNGVTSDLTTWTEGIGSECGIDLPAYWSDMDWRVVEQTHGTYYYLRFLGCKDDGSDTDGVEAPLNVQRSTFFDERSGRAERNVQRCFDLQGRRVTGQPKPGIYIVDGKKRVVK